VGVSAPVGWRIGGSEGGWNFRPPCSPLRPTTHVDIIAELPACHAGALTNSPFAVIGDARTRTENRELAAIRSFMGLRPTPQSLGLVPETAVPMAAAALRGLR
jgi:hypothetical protein